MGYAPAEYYRFISIHALREEGDIELQCVGIAVA